jgi:DNA excision repair protein ERCC-2
VSNAAAVRVSVTALASFACRQGDLMLAGVVGPTAKEGMLAHKRVQSAAIKAAESDSQDHNDDLFDVVERELIQLDTAAVEAEVTLSCRCSIGETDVQLSGRVDLIDYRFPKLSEIKTTLVPSEQLPESQQALQWAQLYLYGFLYLDSAQAKQHAIDELVLELIHVNLRANTQESEQRTKCRQDLINHAMDALGIYLDWLAAVEQWRKRLSISAAVVNFPYQGFRLGQRDMAAAVYRAARDASSLMVEAPTGIGKTISGLFPATKAMGEGRIKQVVYLTAKVAGRLSAMQSLEHLSEAGLKLTAIQIRAKYTTCFCSNGLCERDEAARCPMTLGFFDRLPAARSELLGLGIISGEQLDAVAWEHQLCPFELALQLLPWMQVVIADYNYVFDPMVRLPHFSESRKDALLLVDEAHNLVDRSRSMYSAKLSSENCALAARQYRSSHPLLASAVDDVSRQLLSHASSQDEPVVVSDVTSTSIRKATRYAVELLVNSFGQVPALPDSATELFKDLCRYIAIDELFGEQHRCISRVEKSGKYKEVAITLYCLDASKALEKQYSQFKAPVLFSATLRPGVFYRDTLGLPQSTAQLLLESPFESERACHAIVDWIDIRYRQRSKSLAPLIDLIAQSTSQKSGNYLVFFPSYAYLEQAHQAFVTQFPEVDTWCQSSVQSRDDHHHLLDQLDISGHRVGFAILGGVFGEGIDYIGNRLIGVIIVGTGLPGLDVQTRLVSDHYRESGQNGFDFAYRYPGFTRVLQTAGRLIRHEQDKGIVILVDDRFKQSFYRGLYPENWAIRLPESQHQLTKDIRDFWATLPG